MRTLNSQQLESVEGGLEFGRCGCNDRVDFKFFASDDGVWISYCCGIGHDRSAVRVGRLSKKGDNLMRPDLTVNDASTLKLSSH